MWHSESSTLPRTEVMYLTTAFTAVNADKAGNFGYGDFVLPVHPRRGNLNGHLGKLQDVDAIEYGDRSGG